MIDTGKRNEQIENLELSSFSTLELIKTYLIFDSNHFLEEIIQNSNEDQINQFDVQINNPAASGRGITLPILTTSFAS